MQDMDGLHFIVAHMSGDYIKLLPHLPDANGVLGHESNQIIQDPKPSDLKKSRSFHSNHGVHTE